MEKEIISDKQAIALLTLFIMGTTLIIGTAGAAKSDAWISHIIAMLAASILVMIYGRILSLFPEKDLFDILQMVFGKFLGKFITLLFIWYSFHLGSLVLRNFGEFIESVSMPETPLFVPMFLLGLLCIMVVKAGIEVLGRSAKFFLPIILVLLIVVIMIGVPQLKYDYLEPVLYNGIKPVLTGAFSSFSFPFAETVLFTAVFFALQPKKSPTKVYLYGLLLGGVFVLIVGLRNVLILGDLTGSLYFPSHVAVSRISVGNFLQRIEGSVAIVFVVGAFMKASVCLFVTCKGITTMVGLKEYRVLVTQVGLLMIYLSYFIYENIMEMRYWAFKVYDYYAFPFQVILPLILWIVAEIRTRMGKVKIK